MFAWILNTKPVNLSSEASTSRSRVGRGCGGGACSVKVRSSSSTPKLLMAEPKNAGVCLPARYSAWLNSGDAPRTRSTSS